MFPPLDTGRQAAGGNRITRRLLIRPGAIGDCLLAFPALLFLKADYTEIWISSPLVPLVHFADAVHSIASTRLDLVFDSVPEGLANRLRGFDEIVSWYGANRPEFREAMLAIHPRCAFLDALPGESWQAPASDFFLEQVGAPDGLIPEIRAEATDPRPSVIIHPFSGSKSKNWPLEKFRELATLVPQAEFADGKFDNLLDLARWLRGARSYIGNDSGISHLAAALGLPTLALFGPTDPAIWAPRGSHVRVLRHQPLCELTVETVFSALQY